MTAAEQTSPPTPSVLVGYDGSSGADAALRWAAAEAELRGLRLTVMQSWHEPVLSERTWRERWDDPDLEERTAAEALDEAVAAAMSGHPTVPWSTVLVPAKPREALVAAAADHELVVVGSRGRGGFAGLALGSVAEHVAGEAPVTVVVVRHVAPDGRGVVVGVDGSTGSRRALLWAADEGRRRAAPVRAVLAWTARIPIAAHGSQPFGAAATGEDARLALHRTVAEQLGRSGADAVELEAVDAPAARAILEAAEAAELIVVGATPAVGEASGALGSVGRQVLRHAPCPVAVAR